MEVKVFHLEIERLKNQWKNSYSEERIKALWDAFKNTNENNFSQAITNCLLIYNSAPLLQEISDQIESVSAAEKQRKIEFTGRSPFEAMGYAQRNNKKADSEFVSLCMNHLQKFLDRKINNSQFLEGCDFLDSAAKRF